MWIGLAGGCWPWLFEVFYIASEVPTRTGDSWAFQAWSGEFVMLIGQLTLWFCSSLIHFYNVDNLRYYELGGSGGGGSVPNTSGACSLERRPFEDD